MAIEVKHATVVVVPDDGVSPVGSDEWNADHQLRLTGPALIGREAATQGAAQEIAIGSGLSLSGGVLSATGGGGGAPVDATYVTLSTNATLTAERVLTAGAGISLTDGGAGGNVTLANSDRGSVAVSAHEAAGDPHPQYLTAAEGDAAYPRFGRVLAAVLGYAMP